MNRGKWILHRCFFFNRLPRHIVILFSISKESGLLSSICLFVSLSFNLRFIVFIVQFICKGVVLHMLFGSVICAIRKYHKYSYYYSGECITCGKIRKEYEKEKTENKPTEETYKTDGHEESIDK